MEVAQWIICLKPELKPSNEGWTDDLKVRRKSQSFMYKNHVHDSVCLKIFSLCHIPC